MDEAAKLSAKEASRNLTASSTSTRVPTLSLEWSPEPAESSFKTPPLSTCSAELEKIDLRLLIETNPPSIGPSTYNTIKIVNLTGLDEEMTSSPDRKDSLKDKIIA